MDSSTVATHAISPKTLALDYTSHPSEMVAPDVRRSCSFADAMLIQMQSVNAAVGIQELRKAIPKHCFQPSYRLSVWYLFRDLLLAAITMEAAHVYIPHIATPVFRFGAWAAYGYFEGLVMTGIWV